MRHHLALFAAFMFAVASAQADDYRIRDTRFGCGRITELTPVPVKPPQPEKRKQEPLPTQKDGEKPKAQVLPKAEQPKGDVDEAVREAEERLTEAIRNLNPGYILRGAVGRSASTGDSVYPDDPLCPRRPKVVPRNP